MEQVFQNGTNGTNGTDNVNVDVNVDVNGNVDVNTKKEKDKKEKVAKPPRTQFVKPTKEEVLEFAKTEQLRTDIVNKWFNHYEANGWKIGKNPMKNWKASYRNWCDNSFDKPPNNKGSSPNPFKDRLRKLEEEEKIIEAEQV